MSQVPALKFNDGKSMPQLGFGLWQVPNGQAEATVLEAFRAGYRSIDGARIYDNEEGLGRAVHASGLRRAEIFVTTKLWNEDQGRERTKSACQQSLRRLALDYVDLYLIHWPSPSRDLYVDSWQSLIELRELGLARSIGVSNFTVEHLKRLKKETGITPAVNQVECHPAFQQRELRAYHAGEGILTEAWSPLGQGTLLKDPALTKIAARIGKTPAQVILRWHLDQGIVAIPKSVTPSRIRENFEVFDFRLEEEDHRAINALDRKDGRIGPDPETANF